MAEAARIVEANGADIIDINMGCPAKKVTGGYSGSALMRDPDHALSLIEATVNAATVPVTLKMRLGWDENSINAPLIARRAEEAGVKAITIHGRTRMQFYNGKADWDAIRAVREVVSVPLIANGDVGSVADAHEILRRSGADAVMVGRSCQGRPWHAGVLAGAAAHPDASGVACIFAEHYEMMLEFYGVEVGLRTARKHAGWYLDRFAPELPASEKAAILTSTDTAFVRDSVVAAIARSGDAAAREEIAA
jgi:nifR3 family TIM-barrel protein